MRIRRALNLRNLSRSQEIALQLVLVAIAGGVTYGISEYDTWMLPSWALLVAGLYGVPREWPERSERLGQLGLGVGFFALLYGIYLYAPSMWFSIAWELHHGHYLFYWNDAMRDIPFNDGAFLWKHRAAWLDPFMAWTYANCFDLVAWVPIVRSLASYNFKKMVHYALAAHVLQFPLIMPFYIAIRIDEVWYVLGHPDPIARGWDEETAQSLAANCFPSMHTSVAVGVMLIALREKNPAFRRLMAIYCVLIVISTMYMEIHWVIDVLAGIPLAIGAVWLADWLMRRWGHILPGAYRP